MTNKTDLKPALEAADIAGRYELPRGYTDADLQYIINKLAADLRRAAGTAGGVGVSLVVRREGE